MGPTRRTRMMQAKALAKHCAHGVLFQPASRAVIVLGVHADPWSRLNALLKQIPNYWPTDGWILYMTGLTCPLCGYENLPRQTPMVELQQDGTIYCQSCGRIAKAAPSASAAGLRT